MLVSWHVKKMNCTTSTQQIVQVEFGPNACRDFQSHRPFLGQLSLVSLLVGKLTPALAGRAVTGIAHSNRGQTRGCADKTVKSLDNACHT